MLLPSLSDIARFNLGRVEAAELQPFTVKEVYEVFIRTLNAEETRRNFLQNRLFA